MTFAQINTIAFKLPVANNDRNNEIQCMCISAEQNAMDTVYVDKSAPVEDYDRIALASLECLLSDCSDAAIIKWFAKNGVAA